MCTTRVLLVVLLVGVFVCRGEEEVKEVLEVRTACLYHKALAFSCPTDHIVVLRRARYFVGESEGCITDDHNTCEVQNVIDEWFSLCHASNTCAIDVRAPNRTEGQCADFQGDPFLEVIYKCEPYMGVFYETSVRDMCDFGAIFQGSLMYLWNANYPHFSSDIDCGCHVTVDREIELQIKVPHFEMSDDEVVSECNQAIDIQGGYVRQTICSKHQDVYSPVEIDIADNVYIHYRNPQKYYARIWIVLQVHYEHNFTIDCERNFRMPSLPTLPHTTEFTTEDTQEGSSQKSSEDHNYEPVQQDMQKHWPIITAVVAVLCVALVTGITVLLFCRTRLRDKIMKQKGIVETENFRFDNAVYMNHNQVDRQSNRSSDSGSQHHVAINMAPSSGGNPRHSSSTISLHSSSPLPLKRDISLPPIPTEPDHSTDHVPDIIPATVLQRLGFQSETSAPEVNEIRGLETAGKMGEEESSENGEGPLRNNSLSVKDRANLIENNGQNSAV